MCKEKVQSDGSKHRTTGLCLRGTALCGITLLCAVLELLEENFLGKQNLSLPANILSNPPSEDTLRQEISSTCLGNSIPSTRESLTKGKCWEKLNLLVSKYTYNAHKRPDFLQAT